MNAINTKKHITEEQKAYLVEFIEKHPELKSGKFTQTHTHQKAKELWLQCTEEINQLVGPQKDWKSWKKCWQDARSKAKKKKSVINRHRNETGGGKPISDELTPIEERIVDLQSIIAVEGHQQTKESLVKFECIGPLDHMQPPEISAMDVLLEEPNREPNIHDAMEDPGYVLWEIPAGSSQQAPPPKAIPKVIKEKECKASRRFATSRLSLSVLETKKFNEQMNSKLTIKQNYYNDKLAMEEKKLAAKTTYREAKLQKMDMLIGVLNCITNKLQ